MLPDSGGVQRYTFELARSLTDLGNNVTILAFLTRNALQALKANNKMQFTVVPLLRQNHLMMVVNLFPRIAKLARRKAHLATFVTWKVAVPAILMRFLLRSPIVIITHALECLACRSNPVLNTLMLWVLRKSTLVVAVSNFTRNELIRLGVPQEKIVVIHNGVDPDQFKPGPKSQKLISQYGLSNARVILTVSRLIPRKDHLTVLRALKILKERFANIRYLIVGDGPMRPKLEQAAKAMGLSEDVIFTGDVSCEELKEYYNLCDVFVMTPTSYPSRGDYEGFGLVYLEAGACEKPVVGTRTGGVPDAISHGETGFLCEPENPEEVASSIATLLENETLCQKFGKQARKRILAGLTWQHVAHRLLAVLAERQPT